MNVIVLHGSLGERFGSHFKLDCSDVRDGIRALCVQLPGFREVIRDGSWLVLREMFGDKFALDMETLGLQLRDSVVHIIPGVEGASTGKSAGKLILGLGLVALTWWNPFGWALDATIFANGITWGALASGLGIGLALGGAAMLISPTPKLSAASASGSNDQNNSRLFGSNVNPSGQNFAVPVAYGRIRVAAYPVASQIQTNEVDIPTGAVINSNWNGAGLEGTVSYGNPPVLVLPSTPAIPTDSTTLWVNSAQSYRPYKLNTGSNPWTWVDAGGTLAGGIWSLPTGEKIYVQGQANEIGQQVGDLLVGIATQVWTGSEWVPA